MPEDPVARQMIKDHVSACAERADVYTHTLQRMDQKFDMIWKEISWGRTVRFKLLVTVIMFLTALIVALIAYIWQSSPAAGAPFCLSHTAMEDHLRRTFGEKIMFEAKRARSGFTVRIYVNAERRTWSLAGERNELECLPDSGKEYKLTPPAPAAVGDPV